jgi:hypothetical protein
MQGSAHWLEPRDTLHHKGPWEMILNFVDEAIIFCWIKSSRHVLLRKLIIFPLFRTDISSDSKGSNALDNMAARLIHRIVLLEKTLGSSYTSFLSGAGNVAMRITVPQSP